MLYTVPGTRHLTTAVGVDVPGFQVPGIVCRQDNRNVTYARPSVGSAETHMPDIYCQPAESQALARTTKEVKNYKTTSKINWYGLIDSRRTYEQANVLAGFKCQVSKGRYDCIMWRR